jgi:hypothetical protein
MRARCLRALFGAVVVATVSARAARAENDTRFDPQVVDQSFWTGARAGLFAPYGGLFREHLVTTSFRDVAAGGADVEVDVGARFATKWTAYGFWQFARLGTGNQTTWSSAHGAQTSATTHAAGVALRWTAHPGGWGPLAEVGLGYRWLIAGWEDETTLLLRGLGDARLGVGVHLRLSRELAISPVLTIYTGAFRDRTFAGRPIGDGAGSYTAVALDLGGHFDLFGSAASLR